ncbi:hypothetical protein D7V86_16275 [bacterium D16-51]|nr:hypothetical protein D7V96_15905 [bacterium D16-59]RKI58033.1 hypothetical protein D7V86_16275 [bacterium D16-51]
MQNKLWTVLKIQFLNQSGLNQLRYENNKKKRGQSVTVLIGITILGIILVGFSFLVGFGYGIMGMAKVIPGFALTMVSLVTLFFSFVKTSGYLFAFQDYDMLMSLPLSVKTIVAGKFLYMYLNNLLFSLAVMLPMGSAYFIYSGSLSFTGKAAACLMWIVAAVLAPLLPMTIASFFGTIASAIGSKSRFKVLVQVVFMMIFLCGLIALNIFLNTMEIGNNGEFIHQIEDFTRVVQQQMHRFYPISALFDTAVNNQGILEFLGFVVLSFGVYYLFVVLAAKKYRAINTALMSKGKKTVYHMKEQKGHSVITAMVYKEWKRMLSSAPYLLNIGVGMLLAVVASVVCLTVGKSMLMENEKVFKIIWECRYCAPFMAAVFLTMSCTTSVSLSLEGKNLWILLSLPVSWKTILKSKMAFNMVFLLPAAFICTVCLGITLQLDALSFLLFFVVLVSVISFSTVIGMFFNICFQKYQWENEVEVVKQGMSVSLGILVNMFLQMILIGVSMALSFFIDGRIVLAGISVFFFLLSVIIYYALLSGEKSRIKA